MTLESNVVQMWKGLYSSLEKIKREKEPRLCGFVLRIIQNSRFH